jgi:hypothetical protein
VIQGDNMKFQVVWTDKSSAICSFESLSATYDFFPNELEQISNMEKNQTIKIKNESGFIRIV